MKHQNDRAERDELVTQNLGLVRNIANRFANRGECTEDLRQVGYIGLLKAADRFDRRHGVAFATYGYVKIIGEIRRYFRDKCWSIRIPRKVQDLLRSSDVPGPYRPLSLDASLSDGGKPLTLLDVLGNVDHGIEEAESRIDISAACTWLSQHERSILRLRFFDELTQKAIGRALGRSQMYVSRLEKRALSKLRDRQNRAISSDWRSAAQA
ncbi:MAG TPA: sigma-70 family RNA polymerase sigma factor [Candidatus Eremiobacteraceae bacterium]|nr:sigma-70 family RNA polymerase sigma factor [Candidatus Eremiobacteraceae bacterium]